MFFTYAGRWSDRVADAFLVESWPAAAIICERAGGDVTPIFATGTPQRRLRRAGSVTLAVLLPLAMVGMLVASIAYSSGGTMQLGQLQQNWGQRISK